MIRKLYCKISGYTPDSKIETKRLIKFFFDKGFDLIRGFILFSKMCIFVGKKTKILSRKKISFGKWLNISHHVFLDGLSQDGIILGNRVSIGCYTRIECTGSFSNLGKGFKCGNNCGLGTNCFYGAAGGIEIGDDVIVGNFVTMHSENHNFNDLSIPIRLQGVNHKGIKIGNNCWIGAKATILDGSIIGNGCVIAAGALVRGEFPDNVVIGGVPARILKERK